MSQRPTFGERFRYRFDNVMARGAGSMVLGLGLIALVLLLVFSAIVFALGIAPEEAGGSFFQIFWMSLMRTLDSGTMGGDSGNFGLVMLLVTMVGIFILSALIGIINNGIESRLDKLRKGRSRVIEKGHTVILGWSDQVFQILSELSVAFESERRSCIVVMGDRDKVQMEEDIRDHLGRGGRTRIICRSGSPIDMANLAMVNPDDAKSIIVLSPDEGDPDAFVIKTLLAITNNPDRKRDKYHIVAMIRDPANTDVARMVGKDEAEIVIAGDTVSRVIAQTCRQSGLSLVYQELLDFGGDEIYFLDEPSLAGKTYGECLNLFEDSCVMGLEKKGALAALNPPMDTVIERGDRLVGISEDDSTFRLPRKPAAPRVDDAAIASAPRSQAVPEKTLILGWNWRVTRVIAELDNYVAPGSTVSVVADIDDGEEVIRRECAGIVKNQAVDFTRADTTNRKALEGLGIAGFNHVIVLSYSDLLDVQEADAKTLVTLLHLRDMAERSGKPFSIVSEMQDLKNRELAQVARVNDFIVSDQLLGLMVSQVSENKALNGVFTDLFDPEGAEIYLRPAADYVLPGRRVSFATVVESAKRRSQTAIGYKLAGHASDAEKSFGVVTNPNKTAEITFGEQDRIIVLSDN